MKVIRKILYALVFLLALFCIFIMVCAFRPDMTQKIEALLYKDRDLTSGTDMALRPDDNPEVDLVVSDVVYLPPSGDDSTDSTRGNDAAADVRRESTTNSYPTRSNTTTGSSARDDSASAGLRSDNAAGYIAPDEAEIVVPSNVSGKSGYKKIEGDAEQIDDAAVDDIQNQLDFGYLGDGLQFDPVYYPYYHMLDDTGQRVYRQIYANANAVNAAFMPVDYVTSAELRNIFSAVYNDHPELFWLETAYSCKYTSTGQCVEIDLKFNRAARDLSSAKTSFNEKVNEIVSEAQVLWGDYEREKYVHDQLLEKISYNGRADMNQSAYSALVNGQSVCAGYARAFQYILQQLGIPCYYCTGYAGESHAWNIVKLSDGFYNVDTTWDDSDGGHYDYFNKTDEDYSRNHLRQELSVYLPPCNGQIFRNLAQSEEAEKTPIELRSREDAGLAEDKIFTDLDKYYEDCYNQIIQNGIGHYTFYNAVVGEGMGSAVMDNYRNGNYRQIYMQRAVDALGASNCTWQVVPEPLQGDIYMFAYEIVLTQ